MPSSYHTLSGYQRIALLTDGYSTPFLAKTAISLLRYRTDDIAAILESDSPCRTADELFQCGGDIPVNGSLAEIEGCDALFVGIAPPGGKLPEEWKPIVREAIEKGIDVVSGLHDFLNQNAEYVALAKQHGVSLIDVRSNSFRETANKHDFRKGNIRIHAMGHDCSIGKMVVMLELEKAIAGRGHTTRFLATGQTGIMISGKGVPADCVVADFVNGAVEQLAVANEDADFSFIEGQGSISHPAYSAVTAGLLHGCAPHGIVFCYEAGRECVKGFDGISIPPMKDQMDACLAMANLRHPCKLIGIAVNTRTLTEPDAMIELDRCRKEFSLPVCDVYRTGSEVLADAAEELRNEVLGR